MRDKQREETRRKLYHAALEVFARDGVANCRIEDIAQKADVSRAAFYFHFPTKDDVLLELLRESEAPVTEAFTALPDDASLQRVFDLFIEHMASFWEVDGRGRLLVEVFSVSLRRQSILADREAEVVRHAVGKHFQRAALRGELSAVIPPEVLADFYLLNCLAALASWAVQPIMPIKDMLAGVTTLFMNGARAPQDPLPPREGASP